MALLLTRTLVACDPAQDCWHVAPLPQVYVKRGSLVLRDEVVFHIGCLGGCGSSMAAAVQAYASGVCRDLGLGPAWCGAVMRYMGTLISQVNEVGVG